MHRYFEIGSRQVWPVDPNLEVIHLFESMTTIRVLTRADEFDGGDLIPGHKLALEYLSEGEAPGEDANA